jgi:hypothetical protein
VNFARVAKTQVVTNIDPDSTGWKWGTRSCVATPTEDGEQVKERFDGGLTIGFSLFTEEAGTAGGQIAAILLRLGQS